jgi:RNA polymerase sigma-70 factor (ECF subfamily)
VTESKLITKARQQNREAQRALYDMYKTYWYMLSLRYNRNEQDAQDVLQDAMVQIFSKLEQFDSTRGIFKSWSGRIVINQSLMHLRKHKVNQNVEDIGDHPYLENENDSAIDILSAEELTKIIQQLPDGYRTVFNLYVLEGYNHKEISALLRTTEGTSKSQLFKAKKMLREKLEVLYSM